LASKNASELFGIKKFLGERISPGDVRNVH
jgi:hypothetical protein